MAKVQKNIVMRGLSGSIGEQLVVKRDKGGRTIVSVMPTFPEDREFTDEQRKHQEDFKEAVDYAKAVKSDTVYTEKAEGLPLSGFNVAVADWFHEPEVEEIDLSEWTGQAGQSIRIKALDDVKVERVTVLITNAEGVLIEQGAAVQEENGLWWMYTTTQAASGEPKVIAIARDLPGHIGQLSTQATQVVW